MNTCLNWGAGLFAVSEEQAREYQGNPRKRGTVVAGKHTQSHARIQQKPNTSGGGGILLLRDASHGGDTTPGVAVAEKDSAGQPTPPSRSNPPTVTASGQAKPHEADKAQGVDLCATTGRITLEPDTSLASDGKLTLSVTRRFEVRWGDGYWEVPAWGLRRRCTPGRDAAWHIVRAILDFQALSLTPRGLSDEDKLIFAVACEDLDYRQFCAGQSMPSYVEGRVLRGGENPRLLLNWEREWSPPAALVPRLHYVQEGDDFGGYFTFDADGNILDIANVRPIPPLDEKEIDAFLNRGISAP